MSAALLKKSLSLCENTDKTNRTKAKRQKARITNIDKKRDITSTRKLSVIEVKQQLKSKETILKHNLQMLKEAKKACKVKLNKDITDQIVKRATSRKDRSPQKPVETRREETLFTEEDFKKFEEEYIIE